MPDDILGSKIVIDPSGAMDALAVRVAETGLTTPSGINAEQHLDAQEDQRSTAQQRREDRLNAVQSFGRFVSSAQEFHAGLLGALVSFDVATPGEQERFARQQIALSLPNDADTLAREARRADREQAQQERENSPYMQAVRQRRAVEFDLQNEYAAQGDLGGIGGNRYRDTLQERLVHEGITRPEPTGPMARLREDLSSEWGPLNYAFAAGAVAQGVGGYYSATNSGRYVSTEDRQAAAAGLAPGIGALAGTLIGSMTPVGGWAGGMIGGAAGEVYQSTVGAQSQQDTAARQIAEQFTASLGTAASALKDFEETARATGAPLKDLQQSLVSAQSAGVAGPGTIAGTGRLVNALGETAVSDISALAQFSRRPTLYGIGQRLAAGDAGPSDFNAAAWESGSEGDFAGMAQFQAAARKAQLAGNPDYQNYTTGLNRARTFASYLPEQANNVGDVIENAFPFFKAAGLGIKGWWDSYHAGEIENNLPGDPQSAYQGANAAEMARLRSAGAVGAARLDFDSASLQRSRQSGAFASLADAQQYQDSLRAQEENVETQIAAKTLQYINPATSADLRPTLQQDLYQLGAQARQIQTERRGARHDTYTGIIGESSASDSYNDLMGQLQGQSPEHLLSGRLSQAAYLQRMAFAPGNPLTPSEQFDLAGRGAQYAYQAKISAYEGQEARLGLGVATAQAGVDTAQGGGTPGQVSQAQTALTQQLIGLEQQYKREAADTNQEWSRRIEMQQKAVELGAQINNLQDQQRQQYNASEAGIYSANQDTARAGIGRRVLLDGSAAYAALVGPDAQSLADAQRALSTAPPGTLEYAQARARVAGLGAQQAEDAEQSQIYRRTSSQRVNDSQVVTAYQLSQIAPYADGNDPLTASAGLMQNLRGRLTGVQAAERSSTGLAYEQNVGQENALRLQIAQIQHDRMFAFERMLPEAIINAPGGGYGSYAIPTAGMATGFGHGSAYTGSFGRPAMSNINMAAPAGPAGDFLTHALGGKDLMGGGGVQDVVAAINSLKPILQQTLNASRGASSAPMAGPKWGVARNGMNTTLDPSRPFSGSPLGKR